MRIATSTIYNNQTASIDNLSAQYQSIGQDLSTGKSLNVPSDDPAQISQDLTLTNTINQENGDASNAVAAQNELTFTDSTLSSLTSLLQTARSLAVEGATDIIPNGAQRPLIGKQISGLLNQALGLANQKYGNTYIFAGTRQREHAADHAARFAAEQRRVHRQQRSAHRADQRPAGSGRNDDAGGVQPRFDQRHAQRLHAAGDAADTMDKEPASIQSQQPINVTQPDDHRCRRRRAANDARSDRRSAVPR